MCACMSVRATPSARILQNFHSLATYLSQCSSTAFLDIVSDFHLLLFLVTNEVMPLRVRRCFKATFALPLNIPLLVFICVAEHVEPVTFFPSPEVLTGGTDVFGQTLETW